MSEKSPICTIIESNGHHCIQPAMYSYQVTEGGELYYLCFEHWGMTASARVADKDNIYTTSLKHLAAAQEEK